MQRTTITPILLNDMDKKILLELSARLQRNQSDTVRVLIRAALDIVKEQDVINAPTRDIRQRGNSRMKAKNFTK